MKRKDTKDTYSYKGWIISDNFLKRAFAIYGHGMVAALMISIPFYILIFIFVFIFSLLFKILN
jgi:flagellar biosynthesis protein FliP